MKFSTKGRYGLKAMVDLAAHNDEGQVVLKSIAERQGLSESYLEQLFAVLKKAKLIKSIRGSQGGYSLALSPDKITVADILNALEGVLIKTKCIIENGKSSCSRFDYCVTKNVWIKIQKEIDNVTNNITLQQLVEDFNEINKNDENI